MTRLRLVVSALAFGLLAATGLRAQRIDVGLKIGLERSSVSSAQAEALGMTARYAPAGGAFLAVNLAPIFAVQPEVMFMPKGGTFPTFADQGQVVTMKLRLSYVEVPVLAKLSFPIEGTRVKPSVFGGPALAFKTGCSVSGESGGTSASATCTTLSGGGGTFKSTDVSAILGAGLDFPIGKMKGVVEARFDLGLMNVDDSGSASEVKNRAFAAFVGFSVPLGISKSATERAR